MLVLRHAGGHPPPQQPVTMPGQLLLAAHSQRSLSRQLTRPNRTERQRLLVAASQLCAPLQPYEAGSVNV